MRRQQFMILKGGCGRSSWGGPMCTAAKSGGGGAMGAIDTGTKTGSGSG